MNTIKPEATPPVSVARHYVRYLNGNAIAMALGFITFPVMARLLTKSQFGILGYFDTFALIWMAILKLGSQHAIIRFYSALAHNRDAESKSRFYASFVLAPAIVSTGMFAVSLIGVAVWVHFIPTPNAKYLYVVLALGQLGVLTSLIENILRARELSRFASSVMVFGRILQSSIVIALLLVLQRTATTVFAGRFVAAVVMVIFLWTWFRNNCHTRLKDYDPALFRQSMSFGIPLVSSELALITMAYVGRILLKSMGGGYDDVGTFYLGYGMASSIASIIGGSVFQAFVPVANRLYEERGADGVQDTKQRLLRMLVPMSIVVACLLYFIGGDAFMLLAGRDKAASVPVFQFIGYMFAISYVLEIAGYGLIIAKRSKTVLVIILTASVVNVVLNLLLIPHFGLMGSVYASLTSYTGMGIAQNLFCPAYLRTRVEWKSLGWPVGLGLLLASIAGGTRLFGLEGYLPRIVAMLGLTTVVYVIPLVLVVDDFRQVLGRFLPFLRRAGR